MYLDVKGLIVGVKPLKEADRRLIVMTEGPHGKLRVTAKGAGRRLSPLSSASQLFSYSRMTLFENRGFYTLDAAEMQAQFFSLSEDVTRLALASYFAEVLDQTTEEGIDCTALTRLALTALYQLSVGKMNERQIKAVFEWKTAALLGYEPELDCCAACGKAPVEPSFHIGAGALHCAACRGAFSGGVSLPLGGGVLDIMRFVEARSVEKCFSFSVGEQSLDRFAALAEAYLLIQLERGFPTLAYYKKLAAFDPFLGRAAQPPESGGENEPS